MKKSELRVAVQEMDTHQFGLKNELHNKLTKVTSYVPKKEVIDLIDQLEEPDQDIDAAHDLLAKITTLSQEDFDLYWNCINDGIAVSELKQKKVVVPQFVGVFIKRYHRYGKPLIYVVSEYLNGNIYDNQIQNWIYENTDTFFLAYMDGYTVEEEKRYQVKLFGNLKLSKSDITGSVGLGSGKLSSEIRYELTEQEIKNIDERYWAFAEEVTK